MSAGLVALSAAAVHGQYAPGLTSTETSKPWSFSATLRGFYDDNYLTLPKYIPGPNGTSIQGARGSFGMEVSPSIAYNRSLSDTLISASYVYDLKWYADRLAPLDQTHQFNGKLAHEFSERYKMTVTESFAVAQDPGVLDPVVVTTPLRVPGSNIRNTAIADFTAQMTKLFDIHASYNNTYYAYQENAGDEAPANSYPSYSALLDRMEQTATIDLRWKALPETTGVAGIQYENVGFTSPEDIIFSGAGPVGSPAALNGPGHYVASVRDNNQYFGYVGADQGFTPNLNASLRAGAEYIAYYNFGTSEWSPYVDASVTWQYLPQCTAQVGIKEIHNATDVAGIIGSTPVLDEQTTTAYLSVSHRLNSKLTVALMGQAQYSTFNGGGPTIDGLEENFYQVNLNIAYQFNPWLLGETGYSYNKLNTEIVDRGYTRNLVYIGIRANY